MQKSMQEREKEYIESKYEESLLETIKKADLMKKEQEGVYNSEDNDLRFGTEITVIPSSGGTEKAQKSSAIDKQ